MYRPRNRLNLNKRNFRKAPKGSRRNSKSKLKTRLRVSKAAISQRFVRQRRKLPRSTSELSRRSKRPRRRLPRPPKKLRDLPRRLKIRSISLI